VAQASRYYQQCQKRVQPSRSAGRPCQYESLA
jgi:hypothetical protein